MLRAYIVVASYIKSVVFMPNLYLILCVHFKQKPKLYKIKLCVQKSKRQFIKSLDCTLLMKKRNSQFITETFLVV